MTAARDLADRFHERWLHANPFAATMYGIPGYDDLLPDDSAEGQQAWRAEASRFLDEAAEIGQGELTQADAVTLDCTTQAATQEVTGVDMAADEHTVTAMQYSGPAMFLAAAARTVLVDEKAAEDYLTRVRGSGTWLDQVTERLRAGASAGRLPVAPRMPGSAGCLTARRTTPGRSRSTRPCRCRRRTCTRPGLTTSRPWRHGRLNSARS
jgi:uncharacterized protein (DUF885 family)